MIAHYYTMVGELERAHVLDFSTYRIGQKIALDTSLPQILSSFLQARALSRLVCKAADKDDMDHYFHRARKEETHPVDIIYLLCVWCRNHISNAFANGKWSFVRVVPILNEAEEIVKEAIKTASVETYWIYKMFQAMIYGLRTGAAWNVGENQEALEHAARTVELVASLERKKIFGYAWGLSFVLKVYIEAKDQDNVVNTLRLINDCTFCYHGVEGAVEEALSFLSNPKQETPTPVLLNWVKNVVYRWDETAFLASLPGSFSDAISLEHLLSTEFEVEDFIKLNGIPDIAEELGFDILSASFDLSAH